MRAHIRSVGVDAHKDTLRIAVLEPNAQKAVEWKVQHDERSVKRLARKRVGDGTIEVRACYEAGPTGYSLQRALEPAGVPCEVIASALIPQKAGDRIRTERRNARKLAELLGLGC